MSFDFKELYCTFLGCQIISCITQVLKNDRNSFVNWLYLQEPG